MNKSSVSTKVLLLSITCDSVLLFCTKTLQPTRTKEDGPRKIKVLYEEATYNKIISINRMTAFSCNGIKLVCCGNFYFFSPLTQVFLCTYWLWNNHKCTNEIKNIWPQPSKRELQPRHDYLETKTLRLELREYEKSAIRLRTWTLGTGRYLCYY